MNGDRPYTSKQAGLILSESRVVSLASGLLTAGRPRQWIKNGLVFTALVFTLRLLDMAALYSTAAAFFCFCAVSSAGYLLNDVADIERDRAHATKRFRPVASGRVPVSLALVCGAALSAVTICLAGSRRRGRHRRPDIAMVVRRNNAGGAADCTGQTALRIE
jgi:hypothetical protein